MIVVSTSVEVLILSVVLSMPYQALSPYCKKSQSGVVPGKVVPVLLIQFQMIC